MFAKFHYGGNDSYLDKLFMPFLFSKSLESEATEYRKSMEACTIRECV